MSTPAAPTRRDSALLLRDLRRLVFVDRVLPLEDAWKVLDFAGIPRAQLDHADA